MPRHATSRDHSVREQSVLPARGTPAGKMKVILISIFYDLSVDKRRTMSDDLVFSDLETGLYAIKLFTDNVYARQQTVRPHVCCPHVAGSQLFYLLRSILFTFATVNKRALIEIVDALYGENQGGAFCKRGECGTAGCAFHTVDWENDEGRTTPLLAIIKDLMRERQDQTSHATLAVELVKPHRRAIANFIAVHKPDHLYAKVMAGSALWVQATGEGHARGTIADTNTACATSVSLSRFKDFNQLMQKTTTANVDGVTKQQRHIIQTPMYVAAPKKKKDANGRDVSEVAEGTDDDGHGQLLQVPPPVNKLLEKMDPLRAAESLCELIKHATVLREPHPRILPVNSILFQPEVWSEKTVQALNSYRLDLFETHTEVKYLPGVCDAADISGGGPASVKDLVSAAKQRHQYGPLDIRIDGSVHGWESLPGLDRAAHVHRECTGSRPFNAFFGFLAFEKCHEFGLPYVDADPTAVNMSAHESATHAHAFVTHEAQLTCPKLLVAFEHTNRQQPFTIDGAFCSKVVELVQQLGTDVHNAVFQLRHSGSLVARTALVHRAFTFIRDNARVSVLDLAVKAFACGRDGDFACAVISVRLALLTYHNLEAEWSAMLAEFARHVAAHMAEGVAAEKWLAERDSGSAASTRAFLLSIGFWFDLDSAGHHWPKGHPLPRTGGPFAASELCEIARLGAKPTADGQRVGFLFAPVATETGFSIILEGHTTVSLTSGHVLVLEEAVRFVLNDPTVRIASSASTSAWCCDLPLVSAPTPAAGVPTLFKGTVLKNDVSPQSSDYRRRFRGALQLQRADGTLVDISYRSVLVQDEEDTKKRKRIEVSYAGHRFCEVYGLDYTRRLVGDDGPSGIAALEIGDDVIVTAYWRTSPDDRDAAPSFEANHVILIGSRGDDGRAQPIGPGAPHGLAVAPIYDLTTDPANPLIDGLNACMAICAWPVQRQSKARVGLIKYGDKGTGKSTIWDAYNNVVGANSMRTIKNMDREAAKQFSEEFTNSLVLYADEVGEAFFQLCDQPVMKDFVTCNETSYERKHIQGLVKTKNFSTYITSTNEMPPSTLGRRWCVVWCSNGLKIVKVGGQAAKEYFDRFRLTFHSPWMNAGVLHFLQHYPLCSNLECYSADKSKTQAAMVNVPRELHLRFLKFLVELPMNNKDSDTLTGWFSADFTSSIDDLLSRGWSHEVVIQPTQLKKIMAAWYKHVCARKEGAEKMANVETTMIARLQAVLHVDPHLAEMNHSGVKNKAATADTTAGDASWQAWRLTRNGLEKFLRSLGFRVDPPQPVPFFARG